LGKLIDPAPHKRYVADDCLKHPWINQETKEIPRNIMEENNLRLESLMLFSKA